MILRLFLIVVCFASPALSQTSSTETHYIAPIGAVLTGTADGSLENPWPGVWGAINSGEITGGETLLLMDGEYGSLKLYKISFDAPVVIRSLNGKGAHFEKINVGDFSGNMTFENLSIWPSDASSASGVLFNTSKSSFNVIIDGADIRSDKNAADFFNWDLDNWLGHIVHGITLNGRNSVARNNQMTGVAFAIQIWGDDSSAINNIINGYSGDGIRALGQRNVIRGNRITNAFKIGENHDDGIQSWANSGRGSVEGLVIEDNVIIEWTGPVDHPLRSSLQGIGLFDGFYDNLVIRNNVIAVTLWHGLAVYGGRNATIVNNTVVHNDGVVGDRPWIGIFDHKNGTPSENVLVANNLAMLLRGSSEGVVFIDNSIIFDPAAEFEDIASYDYRPTAGSGFVDTANADYAPPFDIAGKARPIGNGPDRGAYEVGEAGEVGTTGGTGNGGATGGTGDGGTTGGTGDVGTTGGAGDDGATGGAGVDGTTGDTGDAGTTGDTEDDGATGDTEDDGETGDTEDDGATGDTEDDGATDSTKDDGATDNAEDGGTTDSAKSDSATDGKKGAQRSWWRRSWWRNWWNNR